MMASSGIGQVGILATLIACSLVHHDAVAQTIVLPGTLSGTQTWNAASGSATVTGTSTLSGTVTLGLGFEVEYLVVGGGGGGGVGGGGAGGFNEGAAMIPAGTRNVVVGAGGSPGGSYVVPGNGVGSAFGNVTAGGGGRGGKDSDWGGDGGSGGGGGGHALPGTANGDGIGHAGGNGAISSEWPFGPVGGGGGGAGGAGSSGTPSGPGNGGIGRTSGISGSEIYYAGGGAGKGNTWSSGAAGLGGGGTVGEDGAANTGGGGGGYLQGGLGGGQRYTAGGSGIVIVRYRGSSFASGGNVSSGGGSATGYTLHTYTQVGSSSFVLPAVDGRLAATVSANLSGTGGLRFTGPGVLTLTGSNSYTGQTTVSSGTLVAATPGTLPGHAMADRVVFGGGTLRVPLDGVAWTSAGVGTLLTNATKTSGAVGLDVASGTQTFSASMTGGIGLTKVGAGTLAITGSNSFTGATRVSAGTLAVGAIHALAGSTLDLAAGDAGAVALTVPGTNTYSLGGLQGSRNFPIGANSLSLGAGGASTTYAGGITGSGGITKLGAGTLTLTGSNSFTGATRVVSGTLLVSSTSALAGSTLDLAAGDAGTAALQSGLERINLGGLQGSRNLALGSQALWVGGNNTSTVYAGQFTGFGSLVKTGSGMLTLTGNSTFSGLTTVSGGTLSIGDGGTTGAIPGDLVTNAETVFNRSDNVTYAGTIQGSGTITKQGPGTLTLTNNNSFGGTLLLGGTLALGTQRPVGASGGIGLSTITFRGGTLRWETADQSGGFSFGIDYSPRFSTAANQAYSIDTNGRSVNFSAGLSSAGGSLTKLGAGTLTLSASNSYTGVTRVAAGTLELGNTQALAGSTLDLAASDLGVVEFRVFENSGTNTYALGGLQGSRSLAIGPNTLSIGGGGASTTYAGSLSGSGGLTKTGAGTLTLTGSSSYSGNTTVDGGTLTLAGGMLGPGTGGAPLIYVGRTSGQTGIFTVASGTVAQGASSGLVVGDSGTGTFNQTGGSVTLGSGGFFTGNNPGGVGTANFSGGTFTGTTGATVVAVRHQGTINVSGSANVTLATLQMGLTAGAPNTTSTVNLDGGRLTVDRVIRDTGTANFSFNGGTLAARGNNAAFMTGLSRAEVRSGGAVIDTGTFAITIGQSLLSSTSSPGGGLTKRGAGTLTLSGSSSYTGGTVVSAGIVSITNSNALGTSGTVVLGDAATGSSGVTLRSTVDLTRDITVSTSGSGVARIEGDTNFITYSGGLSLNRPTTLGGTAADRYGVSGRISGPVGTLTIDAPRVTFEQTAANANTFTGSVAINPGRILQLNSPHGLSSSHAVTANGLFYLNLWGVTGTNLGVVTGTIGSLSGSGTASMNPSVSGTQILAVGGDNANGSFSGSLANGGGVMGLTKIGTGTQTLSGSNSYTGSTTVSAGTLITTTTAALPGFTTAGRIVFNGGTLQVPLDGAAWTAAQVNTLLTNATKTAGAIGLDVASGSQTLAGGIGGGIGLTKRGPGTLALSASSSCTGSTLVSAGTLALGSAGSINASPAVAVAAGATFDVTAKAGGYAVPSGQTLSGNGTVAGSVTLGAGATLSPGASPGIIMVSGSTTFGAGGNYNWQVFNATGTAGAGWDLFSVGGVLDVAATSADPFKVNLWSLSGTGPDVSGNAANWNATTSGTWRIASAAGGITNFSADKFQLVTGAANGTGGFSNSLSGGTFSLAQSGNDLNLVFTAAPPPVITITVASGLQSQGAAGFPLLSGTTPVVKTGLGTLVLDQANPLTGSTTVAQGKLQLADGAALSSSRIVPLAGGTLALTPYLQTTVGGLDPNAGGLTDVGNGLMTVAGGLSATDLVTALLTGLGDGSWNGPSGITSSVAATSGGDRTVGWLDNGDGSVTFAFAAAGDTNLDWQVDIIDAANFLAGGRFDTGLPANWNNGDFTYDGMVDILDAASFLSNGLFDAGGYNVPPTMVAVPEPTVTAFAAVGIGLVGLGALRRKRVA